MPYKVDDEGVVVYIYKCFDCGDFLPNNGSPDPCLGFIPGVAHACCGHGDASEAYVVGWEGCHPNESCTDFTTGRSRVEWRYDGQEAVDFFDAYRREKNGRKDS